MHLLASIAAIAAMLASTVFAANLTRSECLCLTSGLTAYSLKYTLITPSINNDTIIATDTCTSEIKVGACSLDSTYLKDITGSLNITLKEGYVTRNITHTFKYNRELFGADKYALDQSGWKKVPTKEGNRVRDVTTYCNEVCKKADGDLKENCGGKGSECKVQWFNEPDI